MNLSENLKRYIEARCRLWQNKVSAAHQAGLDSSNGEYGYHVAEWEQQLLRLEMELLTTWLTTATVPVRTHPIPPGKPGPTGR